MNIARILIYLNISEIKLPFYFNGVWPVSAGTEILSGVQESVRGAEQPHPEGEKTYKTPGVMTTFVADLVHQGALNCWQSVSLVKLDHWIAGA
jgi:hypothetical protein